MALKNLPPNVIEVIEESIISEFATVSAAGVPIDTPTYCFPDDNLTHIAIATGLAYPAKANRARRNPKVGMLLEGLPGKPIIAIRGMASVRDADLEANARRYLAETGWDAVAHGLSWEVTRRAVWYWTRIIVETTPVRVMWWDSAEAMERPPHIWDAPAGTNAPPSDPSPTGTPSASSNWAQPDWRNLAEAAFRRGTRAHVTVCDDGGWPMPIRVNDLALDHAGFTFTVPAGVPWAVAGPATLTFQGLETFVGAAGDEGGRIRLAVERALPQHPLVQNHTEVIEPSDSTREALMSRLKEEAARRGLGVPHIQEEPPKPTRLALRRKATQSLLDVPES